MNLEIELNTVADIIDFDSKSYDVSSLRMAQAIDLKTTALSIAHPTDDIVVAAEAKIKAIDAEIRWYSDRLDSNCLRYSNLLEEFAEQEGKTYVPTRTGPAGATWFPDWEPFLELDDYDKPETDEDPKYRENMAETSGDELTKADYINRYDMEDDH